MSLSKACPMCRGGTEVHDSTGDHLFLMTDGITWCCTHEEYHDDGEKYYEVAGVRKLPSGEVKSNEEIEAFEGANTLAELFGGAGASTPVPSGSTTGALGTVYRGIVPATFLKYETRAVHVANTLVELEHDLLDCSGAKIADKYRILASKKFGVRNGSTKGIPVQLFGQSIFTGGKKLLITEGELDAMSAYQMFQGSKFTKLVSVVSLPFGAAIKSILDNTKYLKNFKEITICMDQDKAGEDVARDIAMMLPTAKFMELTEKDANDMLTKGKEQDFISAFFSAEEKKPDTIVRVKDIIKDVMKKPVMGIPWPWPSLTKATYGRNPGQGIYVGAGVKQGKSEWINEVVSFDIQGGRKIAVLKYEEPPAATVKKVGGKIDGTFYHKPDIVYSDADLESRALSMDPYLLMYPAFGKATWESTQSFIRYAALSGCETIIIDPLTKLTNTMTSSETETELRKVSDELACMAQDMGFFYIVTCHLKAPSNGPPHERGGKVNSNQFRGSRAMMENTYYMLGIERNRDPDLSEDEQNTSTFVLLEDRNFGNSAKFPVFYNKLDQGYREPLVSIGGVGL